MSCPPSSSVHAGEPTGDCNSAVLVPVCVCCTEKCDAAPKWARDAVRGVGTAVELVPLLAAPLSAGELIVVAAADRDASPSILPWASAAMSCARSDRRSCTELPGERVASDMPSAAPSEATGEALGVAPWAAAGGAPRAAAKDCANMASAMAVASLLVVSLTSAASSVEAVVAVSVEGAVESSPCRDWASSCRRLNPDAFDVSVLGSVIPSAGVCCESAAPGGFAFAAALPRAGARALELVPGLVSAEVPEAAAASAAVEPSLPSGELAEEADLAGLPVPALPAAPDLGAEFARLPGSPEFAVEAGLLLEPADFAVSAVDECLLAVEELLAGLVLLAAEDRVLDAASADEKVSEPDVLEVEDFVRDEEVSAEGGRISSATCHQSIGPGVRGALVGLRLLTPIDGACFLSLEALHHLPDGFGALGGALPVLHLAIPLCASANDNLCLLPQRLLEAGEKGLVITRHGTVDAGLGADREAAYIALVIALQLGELRLAFDHSALTRGKRLGPAALLIVHDVLNHLESLSSFHGLRPGLTVFAKREARRSSSAKRAGKRGSRLPMGYLLFSSTTVRQYALQRCEACREIHALVDILLQKLLHAGPECDGVIDSRITAALIGPNRDQVTVLLIGGKRLAELPRNLHLRRRRDLVHCTADGRFNINGRVVAAFRDAA